MPVGQRLPVASRRGAAAVEPSPRQDGPVTVTVRRGPIVRGLAVAAAGLVACSVAGNVSAHGFDAQRFGELRKLFQLESESNVPTWFGTVLLLLAAVLFAAVGQRELTWGRPWARHWRGLAVIFVVLSALETSTFRESVLNRVRDVLPGGEAEVLRAAWIVPVGVVLLVVSAFYTAFLRALPSWLHRRMLVAALLYLGGAVGLEVLGNLRGAERDLLYFLATDLEEALEMAGVIVLVGALLEHLAGTLVRIPVAPGGR
jgi:hypothetical protein